MSDGEVLVHTPADGILLDKVDGAVLDTHDLLPGVVLGGRADSGPLVDTPGSGLQNVDIPGVLPAHAGQPTDVCGGVPGSLVQLEMMAEHLLGMGMVTGVWSGNNLGNSSFGKQRSCLAASLPRMSGHLWNSKLLKSPSLYIMILAWSVVLVVLSTS